MGYRKLVIVPNPGLYGFGKVPTNPNGFYKWAFNIGQFTIAWLR